MRYAAMVAMLYGKIPLLRHIHHHHHMGRGTHLAWFRFEQHLLYTARTNERTVMQKSKRRIDTNHHQLNARTHTIHQPVKLLLGGCQQSTERNKPKPLPYRWVRAKTELPVLSGLQRTVNKLTPDQETRADDDTRTPTDGSPFLELNRHSYRVPSIAVAAVFCHTKWETTNPKWLHNAMNLIKFPSITSALNLNPLLTGLER